MLKHFPLRLLFWLIFLILWSMPVSAQVATGWVKRYEGPAHRNNQALAIAVDASRNVYVAGQSWNFGTGYDYAIIKYLPNGDTAWVRRYNGPGDSTDIANCVAVDSAGNVYVSGSSWGNGTYSDYATLKYDPNGSQLWVKRFNGQTNYEDEAKALALDGSGNVYVTGLSGTIKYDTDGNQLWVDSKGGVDIALDNSGNAYVIAESYSSLTNYDYATIKYYPDGDTAWVKTYDGPANGYDLAQDIALDEFGNVYVTGSSMGSGTGSDYATIKYDSAGNQLWIERYDGPTSSADTAFTVAADNSGNVYVTGKSWGNWPAWYDYATIKYYPDGDTAWVRRYNGKGSYIDEPHAMAIDVYNNVYVTGISAQADTFPYNYDYATVKYDTDGGELWLRRYNGPGSFDDSAYAIAVDDSGNAYVTGVSWDRGEFFDYVTIKYSSVPNFTCGDANGDGSDRLSDVIFLINYLFHAGSKPNPIYAADCNYDGQVNISDVIYLVNYLFRGGSPPCQ